MLMGDNPTETITAIQIHLISNGLFNRPWDSWFP